MQFFNRFTRLDHFFICFYPFYFLFPHFCFLLPLCPAFTCFPRYTQFIVFYWFSPIFTCVNPFFSGFMFSFVSVILYAHVKRLIVSRMQDFHWLGPLGWVGHIVAMSVCIYVCHKIGNCWLWPNSQSFLGFFSSINWVGMFGSKSKRTTKLHDWFKSYKVWSGN